jgi:hypothetical protein
MRARVVVPDQIRTALLQHLGILYKGLKTVYTSQIRALAAELAHSASAALPYYRQTGSNLALEAKSR